VEEVRKEIEELIRERIDAEITGRPKSFKAIYEKLKKVPFQKMHDIYGVRIICHKEKECYEALGYIHAKYEIIPEAFDDYIAKPKTNGYKSIHTAVKRGDEIIEVQIRTWEQHLRTLGENYWAYKKMRKDKEFEKELSWERQLIEWQKNMGKEGMSKKLAGKKIFVFTPKNEAIPLPIGASVIDFAFAVHTDIGKKMEKAKINGKNAPIETKLNNLDKVEIIVAQKPQVKKTWLNFVESDKAKTKIKAHFGIKSTTKKTRQPIRDIKKIKWAECCHPLPGEDVIGVKTTKRKIVVHKKDCPNIQKIPKSRLMEIGFEREKGKTRIRVTAIDRPGLLAELLTEIRHSSGQLINTNFKIKKSGYAEAIFELEIASATKLEHLIEKLEKIPSVQGAERI
jgi:GTP pyrophosphokinase